MGELEHGSGVPGDRDGVHKLEHGANGCGTGDHGSNCDSGGGRELERDNSGRTSSSMAPVTAVAVATNVSLALAGTAPATMVAAAALVGVGRTLTLASECSSDM